MSSAAPTSITNKIFTSYSVVAIGFFCLLYITLATMLINYRLIADTFSTPSPIQYKLSLFFTLFAGMFSAFGWIEAVFLVTNGVLIGLNSILIMKTLQTLEGMGKVKLTVGGATLMSLVATGCGACGLTVLSLLGVSISLTILPFRGVEIHMLSLIVLLFSAWYMIKKLTATKICSLY